MHHHLSSAIATIKQSVPTCISDCALILAPKAARRGTEKRGRQDRADGANEAAGRTGARPNGILAGRKAAAGTAIANNNTACIFIR